MKKGMRIISFFMALVLLCASCTSTTLIQSNPSKAKVYLNGDLVGETPYRHSDSKIVGSSMVLRLEKDGYNPLVRTITKDEEVNVGAIIGGLFVVVPFLWTMQYQPVHTYELKPSTVEDAAKPSTLEETARPEIRYVQPYPRSKADRLREFKKLLDEKVITADEFEKEKAKVLNEKE